MTETSTGRRRVAALRIALGLVALLALVGALAALWVAQMGGLKPVDLATVLIVCVVVGIAAVGLALTYSPDPIRAASAMTRWDKAQRDRNRDLVINIVGGFFWVGYGAVQVEEHLRDGEMARAAVYIACVLLWLFVAPAIFMGWTMSARKDKAYLDDELSRAFRARAASTGFAALLLGGVGAYLVSLFAPERTSSAILFALWLGGAIASVRFAWLHYRAEEDQGDDG